MVTGTGTGGVGYGLFPRYPRVYPCHSLLAIVRNWRVKQFEMVEEIADNVVATWKGLAMMCSDVFLDLGRCDEFCVKVTKECIHGFVH